MALLAGAALLRLLLPWGYRDEDVLFYTWHAEMLAAGDAGFPERVLASLEPATPEFPLLAANVRLGMSGPMAALFLALGETPNTARIWPFVGSLLHVLVAYLLGRRLWSSRVGLAAAAILASVPFEVASATHVVPDVLSAAWAGCAFLVLLAAEERVGPRALGMGAVAGLLLGLAFLCKESVLFAFPVLALHAACRWRDLRRLPLAHVGFALGALVLPLAEMALYAAIAGDPLFRLNLVEVIHNQSPHWSWLEYASLHPEHPVLRRLLLDLPRLLVRPADFGLLAPATLGALPLVFRRLQPGDKLALGWLFGVLAALALGSTSLHDYKPLVLEPRYHALLVLPASLLVARACWSLADRSWTAPARRRVLVASAALAAACISAAVVLAAGIAWEPARAGYEWLRANGRFEQPFEFHRATIRRIFAAAAAGLAGIGLVGGALALRSRRSERVELGRAMSLALACALVVAHVALAAGFLREHGLRERRVAEIIDRRSLSGLPVLADRWTLSALCWFRDFDRTGLRSWRQSRPQPGERVVVIVNTWYVRPKPPPEWVLDGTVPLSLVDEVRVEAQPPTRILVTDWGGGSPQPRP